MKVLEFKTSKGRFVLVDNPILPQAMSITTKYIKLSEITEEQASSVMSKKDIAKYQGKMCSLNSVFGLNRFLESKGIHLYKNPDDNQCGTIEWQEAEQKTFYNPFIYKL